MNELIKVSGPTMSSREIAELCGKQHKDVLRDIRAMFEQLGIDSAQFCALYKDQQLIDRPCFNSRRGSKIASSSMDSLRIRTLFAPRVWGAKVLPRIGGNLQDAAQVLSKT